MLFIRSSSGVQLTRAGMVLPPAGDAIYGGRSFYEDESAIISSAKEPRKFLKPSDLKKSAYHSRGRARDALVCRSCSAKIGLQVPDLNFVQETSSTEAIKRLVVGDVAWFRFEVEGGRRNSLEMPQADRNEGSYYQASLTLHFTTRSRSSVCPPREWSTV
jgi:hypothetical protein